MKKTVLENLESALLVKKQEMVAVEKIRLAKVSDKSGAWRDMLVSRQSILENALMNLDTGDENFRSLYDRYQAVRDEYRLLLSLLANSEKRIEKIKSEIADLTNQVNEAKRAGEASRQF